MDSHSVYIERFIPSDPRLGRHVRHDSRSLQYLVQAADPATLTSVRHERRVPILDQGNLGSCTGNAAVGCMGTDPYYGTVQGMMSFNEQEAIDIYSIATQLDLFPGQYPPTDTGSDGLSVAKALKNNGLISGYLHATSLAAAVTALQGEPVIAGTVWTDQMFSPDSDGRIHLGGNVAGGHEYELDELDVERQRIWMCNSWGESWGVHGRAYFTWTDFENLLKQNGDVTQFVPITKPAPIPTPPPEPPAPPTPPSPPAPPAPPAPPSPPAPPAPPDPKAEFVDAYKAFVAAAEKYFSQ